MKKDILKIAGVKSEKEFYKKYPTEEAFKKAFPKEFKKAAMGAAMVKKQLNQLTDFGNPPQAEVGTYIGGEQSSYKPINYADVYDRMGYMTTGVNRQIMMDQDNLAAQQKMADSAGGSGTMDILGNFASMAESLKYGGDVAKAQNGLISMPDFTQADKDINRQFKFDNSKFGQGMQKFGKSIGAGYDKVDKGLGKVGGVQGALGIGSDLAQGFQQLKQEKQQKRQAKQFAQLSGVVKDAASSRPEETRRRYVRPEDNLVNPGEIDNPYGTGMNYLQYEHGGSIGGNPTEIQNMYNPGNLYVDLGYEPLDESSNIKQYRKGGELDKAQFGIDRMAGQAGGALGSLIGGGKGRPTAGGQIGSTIGSTVGKFIPIPGASAILGGVGGLVGGILGGKSAKQTAEWEEQGQSNLEAAAFQSAAQNLQNQYSSFMKDGGEVGLKYLSNDWQPQVIASFGEYKLKDLLRPPHDANMLRAGGHLKNYTAPSEAAMSTERPDFAMGGNLKTTWGGYAEPISQNPYLPGTGETVMFRGKSHEESDGNGHTGIGVKYGKGAHDSYTDYAEYGTRQADADVEVERGEPAAELPDPETGGESMVVWGNMITPSYVLSELGEEDAEKYKGEKFKYIAKDYSKQEEKQNKLIDKGIDIINSVEGDGSFDMLKFNAGKAMVEGGNMGLKKIADKKIILAGGQNAILDTAEERGLESDALAKGKIKPVKNSNMAKFGKELKNAQTGVEQPKDDFGLKPWKGNLYGLGKKTASAYSGEEWENIAREMGFKGKGNLQFQRFLADNPDVMPYILKRHNELYGKNIMFDEKLGAAWQGGLDKYFNRVPMQENPIQPIGDIPVKQAETPGNIKVTPLTKKPSTLEMLFGYAAPFLRPSNQEPFDYQQVAPEMLALATNQLEPVQAQTFQPLLEQPYTVSLQDQINEIQADVNASKKLVGSNPAALAAIDAQASRAKNQVLAQQLRMNQELQMGAYNRNRDILNKSTLQNLEIMDRQYTRQSQARSNTKAQAQAALSSIADKMAKQKLENRTLGVYENLYNYRFGPRGQAFNLNAPYEFNTDVYASTDDLIPVKNAKGQVTEYRVKDKETAKNGSIVKAIKNL